MVVSMLEGGIGIDTDLPSGVGMEWIPGMRRRNPTTREESLGIAIISRDRG
jgi:hypothetical protein